MTSDLKNRVAIVTGAGQGIGRAIALTLAELGASVVVNDVAGESGASLAEQVAGEINTKGGRAVESRDSVAEFDAAGKIVQTAIDAFGRLDVLVNNAGILVAKPLWEIDPSSFERVVRVHLFGTYNCSWHAVSHMMAQKYGRIVNVLSRAGLVGTPRAAAYGAAKGGIFGFTNAIARDLLASGINVNAFSPTATDTQMIAHDPRMVSVAQNPARVAKIAAYLCSEACLFTGQSFFIEPDAVGPFAPVSTRKMVPLSPDLPFDELSQVMSKFEFERLKALYDS